MRQSLLGRIWGHDFYCNSLPELEGVGASVQCYFLHGIEIKPGDIVLDVGANIGLFGLQALLRTEFQAMVFSFEPVPDTFAVLTMNCHLTNSSRWRVFNYGLSNEEGSLNFYHNTDWPMISSSVDELADVDAAIEDYEAICRNLVPRRLAVSSLLALPRSLRQALIRRFVRRLHANRVVIECEVKTLATVMDNLVTGPIGLLKIDVEKVEEQVIEGIRPEQFHRIRSIVVEVHDVNHRLERLSTLLKSHGFDVVFDQEPTFRGSAIYNLYAKRAPAY